jgi:hypothetical protein
MNVEVLRRSAYGVWLTALAFTIVLVSVNAVRWLLYGSMSLNEALSVTLDALWVGLVGAYVLRQARSLVVRPQPAPERSRNALGPGTANAQVAHRDAAPRPMRESLARGAGWLAYCCAIVFAFALSSPSATVQIGGEHGPVFRSSELLITAPVVLVGCLFGRRRLLMVNGSRRDRSM